VASPLPDDAVQAPRLWDRLKAARPDATTLVWFVPNARGVSVDFAAWVEPGDDLATRPAGLAADLIGRFGAMPCPRPEPRCEPPRLETTTWILKTAAAVIAERR